MHSNACINSITHTHTHTHTLSVSHTITHTHTISHAHYHIHTQHTMAHTHYHIHTHHTMAHTHTPWHSCYHTHTYTHTHAVTHTHSHTSPFSPYTNKLERLKGMPCMTYITALPWRGFWRRWGWRQAGAGWCGPCDLDSIAPTDRSWCTPHHYGLTLTVTMMAGCSYSSIIFLKGELNWRGTLAWNIKNVQTSYIYKCMLYLIVLNFYQSIFIQNSTWLFWTSINQYLYKIALFCFDFAFLWLRVHPYWFTFLLKSSKMLASDTFHTFATHAILGDLSPIDCWDQNGSTHCCVLWLSKVNFQHTGREMKWKPAVWKYFLFHT